MNSTIVIVESWFLLIDILAILCTSLVILSAIFFLFVIIFCKACHTIPMMLVANSCLAELFLASNALWMSKFTFQNDLQQIEYEDSLCVFRGYLSFSSCTIQNCSYLLQSTYRYFLLVHPNRLCLRSFRAQLCFISLSWIFAFGFPLMFLFNGEILYNIDNQICQIPLRFSVSIIYTAHCLYIIPVSSIVFIYFLLIRYVKEMTKRTTPTNALNLAQRELKMVRHIVILVMILFTAGFPYALFVFMSFFTKPPKYHFRISYGFIDFSLALAMISLFQFNDTLKISIQKMFKYRRDTIRPIVAR